MDTKRLDLDAVGTVNNVSIYEYDIDLGTDEKPWRNPGTFWGSYNYNYSIVNNSWDINTFPYYKIQNKYGLLSLVRNSAVF